MISCLQPCTLRKHAPRVSSRRSLGATVVEMLTGKHPWPDTEHHFATFTQIATSQGGPPVPPTVSKELRDFLNLCFK